MQQSAPENFESLHQEVMQSNMNADWNNSYANASTQPQQPLLYADNILPSNLDFNNVFVEEPE